MSEGPVNEAPEPNGLGIRRRPAQARTVMRELLRLLGATTGFTLIPVEVPGPDLGRALARWLGEHGHPCRVVSPAEDEGWRDLPGRLARTETGPYGSVMVIGPPTLTPALTHGLRVLNQRRDVVIRALDGPLLWVGPREFLRATWHQAPDFWSVRSLTWRVAPRPAPVTGPAPYNGPLVNDDPDHLTGLIEEARRQGDPLNAARMGYLLAGALASRGDVLGARRVLAAALGEAPASDTDLAFDLTVIDARLADLAGAPEEARAQLDLARTLAGESPGKRAQLDLLTARHLAEQGENTAAIHLLEDIVGRCGGERPFLCARALTALGRAYRAEGHREPGRLDDAERVLRQALDLFQGQGEALGEANVLAELGDLARQRARSGEAEALYRGAWEAYRVHGAMDGAAKMRRRLAALRKQGRGDGRG